MYTILYNIHDSKCVEWIEAHAPSDVRLVDWYLEQEDWLASGGTTFISALPSVITPSGVVVTTPSDWNEVIAAEKPPVGALAEPVVQSDYVLVNNEWVAPLEPAP